ncbi:fatty acyl-AMP ligase [Micromonospora sp. CPCC 205371]|nr:fatty acyl-AMP ligase [Micromonospora sp. CPCC 205371]
MSVIVTVEAGRRRPALAPAPARSPVAPPVVAPLVGRLATWARRRPADTAYTFVDFAADPDGVPRELSWGELHRRATALAGRLRRVAAEGDRVAVLAPPSPEYVVALFACWYAGTVAVPLFPPDLPRHGERLASSYRDCAPRCVVTTSPAADRVTEFIEAQPFVEAEPGRPALVLADDDGAAAEPFTRSAASRDDVAYLQYTSGSTRTQAGVVISYGNLAANVRQLWTAFAEGRGAVTAVNWLPLFHDMGLLATVAVPLLYGTRSVFFDPVAFLMRPERWLRLLSTAGTAYTAAPNFAYDYCVRRIDPAARDGFDLSRVFVWLNGAEPVRAGTVAAFADAFAGSGLDRSAICAAYGLAEATVFVAGDPPDRPPTVTRFDRVALAAGTARVAEDGAASSALVSCGRPVGQRVAIVDPDRRVRLPDGQVGEIWVYGANTARRYWRQPELTAEVFGAMLAGSGGLPIGPWMRTGDLGVVHDGELYVTGRRKDLIIVAGRNHYPQDIEATAAIAAPQVADGHVVAFAVPDSAVPDGAGEKAVVVAERSRSAPPGDPDAVAREVRAAVWAAHDLALHDVLLIEPGGLPRTPSGNPPRSPARERSLAGGSPTRPAR